jgi:hypothetical protein
LNSARVFLSYVVYEHDPDTFLRRLRHFVRAAYDRGMGTMPVVWDSCFSEVRPTYDIDLNDWIPNPGVQRLGGDFWPDGERYCQDLVQTLAPEPGLVLWDVMNEPLVTSWVRQDVPNREQRVGTIWSFVYHFCEVIKRIDKEHPITVGVAYARRLEEIGDDVDVLSFHDYRPNRAAIRDHIAEGICSARKFQKPVFISELGCLARANPYDVTLEICQEAGIGWYLWELMIGISRWRDIHGVVYPDGTVRDPSIAAAIRGFFRKRAEERVAPNIDKEGAATRALSQAKEWLDTANADYAQGLAILEQVANLLETGEIAPMNDPPSIKVLSLGRESPVNRGQLCRLLVLWGKTLEHFVTAL